MEKIKLMSHLVAGYATDEISLEVARSLVKGGADILEIQLPLVIQVLTVLQSRLHVLKCFPAATKLPTVLLSSRKSMRNFLIRQSTS